MDSISQTETQMPSTPGPAGSHEMPVPRPALCIVLPNYNHANYLGQAIQALLDQMSAHDSLLVIDDCSTDNSLAVFAATAGEDPRVILIRNETNQGVIYNMNLGLARADSPYVYFAAADDMIMPGFLEKSLTLLGKYPDAALCTAMTRVMDAEGQDMGPEPTALLSTLPSYVPPVSIRRSLMSDDAWLSGNATIYRRDALQSLGGFDPALGSYTDGFAARVLACTYGACFVPEYLSYWRRLPTAYSYVSNLDVARRKQIKNEAFTRMTTVHKSVFPKGYARLWVRRFEFSARALELRSRYQNTSGVRSMILAARMVALFLYLRPADVLAVARRRLARSLMP